MSGHSKWSTIKRKKAAVDAKRGDLFGKFSRAISIAARNNPDPETNHRLRDVIQRARTSNMPSANIERAIRKVSEKDSAALAEVQLEFIGPGDAAVIASAITDNSNRTISELRKLASDHHGRMVNQGSVSWMFRKAMVFRARIAEDESTQQLSVIDAGADDVSENEGELYVTAPPERAENVRNVLGDTLIESSLSYVPNVPHELPDDASRRQLEQLMNILDEHDDVQDVSTNADL